MGKPEINASDAFVAAWFQAQRVVVSQMLYCKPNGDIQYDFRGKLSFSWPRTGSQTAVNIGDSDYDPLFAYGYGLSYSIRHQ